MEWPSEDDPELHALHKERIQQMKEEQEKRKVMESKGHGTYADVNEGEFLPEVTGAFQARSRLIRRFPPYDRVGVVNFIP